MKKLTEYAVQCYHCEKWFMVKEESSGICPICNTNNDLDIDRMVFGVSHKDVKYLNYNWDILPLSPKKEK